MHKSKNMIMEKTLENRLGALRQISERKLMKILNSISGLKDLLIEPALMKQLEKFTGVTALRKHGVEKIFRLEAGSNTPVVSGQRVFLMFSHTEQLRRVLQQLKAEQQQHVGGTLGHHLVLAPATAGQGLVAQIVEEEGLYGLVTLHWLTWELLKLDDGLWSLELPASTSSLMFGQDLGLLQTVARSLWSLQLVLGRPNLVLAQGNLPAKILNLMDNFRWPSDRGGIIAGEGQLGGLLILSRDVDWTSVLMTPVTYTALLNQVLTLRSGHVTLPSLSNAELCLSTSSDKIYAHISNLHFSSVFPYLRAQTQALQSEVVSSKGLSATEMKQYVQQRLSQTASTKKSLTQHIAACEAVVEQVGSSFECLHTAEGLALRGHKGALPLAEELLGQGQLSTEQGVRLMSLLSLHGLHEEAAALKAHLLLCKGHTQLFTIDTLHRRALGGDAETPSNTAASLVGKVTMVVNRKLNSIEAIQRKFRLVSSGEASVNPRLPAQDMSYVFGGEYTPLVCRLLEWVIKADPQLEEGLKLLPGPTLYRGRTGEPLSRPPESAVKPKTFILFIVGGVTYAEVAACRILEALTGTKIIVASTCVLNKEALTSACAAI